MSARPGLGRSRPGAGEEALDRTTVGVDVGGTKLLAVLTDGAGTVLAERQRPVPALGQGPQPAGGPGAPGNPETPDGTAAGHPGDLLIEAVAAEVTALRQVADGHGRTLEAVGLGLPGLVTSDGRLQASAHLPGAEGLAAAASLATVVGLPAVVDNDATCAMLAEWRFGAARACDDVVLVTLGTGIGTGLVVAGRLVRGRHGFAGEAGHMVVDPGGPPCPCGRRGCWERYASGEHLGHLGRLAVRRGEAPAVAALAGGDPEAVRGEHVTAAAAAGDVVARRLVADLAGWLALGLANLVALLDCRRIVIGGGLVLAGADLLGPLETALHRPEVLGRGRPPVEVVGAELGPRAGAVGAALLAGARLDQDPEGGVPGSGVPGSGVPRSGVPGSGVPGSGVPGSGVPG